MGNLITDTKKFYSGFNSSINILITNKDEIKSDDEELAILEKNGVT